MAKLELSRRLQEVNDDIIALLNSIADNSDLCAEMPYSNSRFNLAAVDMAALDADTALMVEAGGLRQHHEPRGQG